MRFQLSTALLLVALLAVSIGWITDRQRLASRITALNESRAQRDEQIYLGSAIFGSSTGKFELLGRFDFDDLHDELAHIKNDPKFHQILTEECVTEFLNIYDHQKEIEIVGAIIIGSFNARLNAREALYLLKCDDVDQFFEIARSLEDFDDPDFYPELHNQNSDQFKSLHKFVSDTIAIKDQM